jgi:hypothetical protein
LSDLDEIVEAIRHDLAPDYADRLRAALGQRDKAWLVDELVNLIVERDLGVAPEVDIADPNVVDEEFIGRFVADHADAARDGLVRDGAPAKGTALLRADHRTAEGEAALRRARELLSALLFGDESAGVVLDRGQQELLTVVLPRHKADALAFLRASTEMSAVGTWHDPENVSNDEHADNVVLEVQFGEVESEAVGTGVLAALRLINELEINEQVLYARMVDVEETSLG